MKSLCLIILLASLISATAQEAVLVGVQKIWDKGEHNAFTDLIRFRGKWFCAFREAEAHASPTGVIRILSSKNGKDWEPASVIEIKDHDLRDPKFTLSPDGKWLEVLGGDVVREGRKAALTTRNFLARSKDGTHWDEMQYVGPEQEWLWRITWFNKKAYAIAYDVHPETRASGKFFTRLYVADEKLKFAPLADPLCPVPGANEATLRFATNGTAYVLQRRDGPNNANSALIGLSQKPYTQWEWKELGKFFGGPNFIQLPDNRWVAVGRVLKTDAEGQTVPKTVLCELNYKLAELREILELPSGGDTSYAGLYWYDSMLWISYYSSHEEKTSIYLAKVKFPQPKRR
jgi:hypothetical protein